MTRLRVAHIKENGVELVLVPIGNEFSALSLVDKQKIMAYLRLVAAKAGLSGIVIPVWERGGGQMGFMAPDRWRRFFKDLNSRQVAAALNSEIDW